MDAFGEAMDVFGETRGHLSRTFKGSLPPLDTLWRLILQKTNSAVNQASDLLKSLWLALKQYPSLKTTVDLVENVTKASVAYLKSAAALTEKEIRAGLPYLKSSAAYSAEKVNQHPYLFGSLVLIILYSRFVGGGGGSGSRKTMKAPGRDSRIFRDDFEGNPRSYFRDLRANRGNYN